MKTSPQRAIGFGVRFNPSAEEAVALYLRRRVVGQQLPDVAGIIHEADVYRFEPKDLAAAYPRLPKTQSRFFFTTCKRQKAGNGHRMSRTAGPGSWVGSGSKKDVTNSAGETIGSHETLKYAYNDKSRKSEWRMDEYRCCGLDQLAVVNGKECVLCRVYVSPNSKEGSVTLQESAAGDRHLGGMQEPPSAMAAAAVQQQQMPRQNLATTTVVQQQLPRRQERVAPVLPAITQPQAIKKSLPPRALDLSSVPRQRCVTNTQQAPKRPAPRVVEPPSLKRMRPTLAPLVVPPVPRHDVVRSSNTPKRPSWCPASAMPPRQASPRAAPRRRPRKSPRSRPVAPPPPPAAEAPTNVMDDDDEEFWRSLEAKLDNGTEEDGLAVPETAPQEDHAMIQEETGNDARLSEAQPEMAAEEDHAMIQEETGNDDDGLVRWAEWLGSQIEEMPSVEEHGGKIQESNDDEGQHASSLEGLVADERGDDVVAQDALDVLSNIDDDPIDGTGDIDYSLPLSAYSGIQF